MDAAVRLGVLLRDRGDGAGAVECLQPAARAGNLDAASELGLLLLAQGDVVEATKWLEHPFW